MTRVTWIALVVAWVGCKQAEDRAGTAADRAPASLAPARDGVQQLSRGDPAAQRTLRYRLAKGTTSKVELTLTLDMDAGGRNSRMPTLVFELAISVLDLQTDGAARIRSTIASARAVDRSDATMPMTRVAPMTAMLTGLAVDATLTPEGVFRDAHVDTSKLPAAMASQVQQLTANLEQLAVPLPDGPVGVGAKWLTKKDAALEGLEVVTVTTYEITSLDGDRVGFTSTTTLTAKDQTGAGSGSAAPTIKDLTGGGSAQGTIDLARLTLDGRFEQEMRGMLTVMGSTAPMKYAVVLTMAPKS